MKWFLWALVLALPAILGVVYLARSRSGERAGPATARVVRGDVIRKAVAVGRIEVEHEIPIKSLTGGILTRLFVKTGQRVLQGDRLAEVRPVLTEQSLLLAERALDLARDGEESTREYVEGKHLASALSQLLLGPRHLERMHRASVLAREQAEEQLRLLREGEVAVEERKVDYIVRAPVDGHVLEIRQREGSPVVPASSYGSGTVFMTLADMSRLVFRGTVDEIDVGRLKEGMAARIRVGALPGTTVGAKLVEIGLKAQERENAVVFRVRAEIEPPEGITLRSGYSAVADIEVDKREGVLTLPERAVELREGKGFVQLREPSGRTSKREIVTGLSDGLTIEILEGLAEGAEVLEPEYE